MISYMLRARVVIRFGFIPKNPSIFIHSTIYFVSLVAAGIATDTENKTKL